MISNEPKLSFSQKLPGLQLAWDSTSLGALKTCPRYYYYNIVMGYVPRNESIHLKFGLVYHAALEQYDRSRAEGKGHDLSIRMAVRRALIDTWDVHLQRPWFSDDKNKNRYTLMRTIVWYLDQFKDDPLETVILANGKPAVELSFRLELGRKSGLTNEDMLLCGHLDRLARTDKENVWIVDHKTTKSTITPEWFEHYSPDNQFTLYTYAGRIVYAQPIRGIIADVAQIAITFSRFQRGPVQRHESTLAEWRDDLEYWLTSAEYFAKRAEEGGLNEHAWPQNDKSCGNYGGCPYRMICGKSPSVRKDWLDGKYVKRIWDPLRTREI